MPAKNMELRRAYTSPPGTDTKKPGEARNITTFTLVSSLSCLPLTARYGRFGGTAQAVPRRFMTGTDGQSA